MDIPNRYFRHMELETYILKQGGTATPACHVIEALAREVGCTVGTMYQIVKGFRTPSGPLSRAIAAATNNEVEPATFRPDIFEPIQKTA